METVPLHGQKAAGRVALVDDEDYELVARFRWNLCETKRRNGSIDGPYAHITIILDGKKSTLRMHKLITGYPQTDHIDRDGLNNQRGNLRPATHAQNMANVKAVSGTSAFKGVSWDTRKARWVAAVRRDGAQRILGYFTREEDAARTYDAAAILAQGEYAVLNFPVPVSAAEAAARRQMERDAFAAGREAYQASMLSLAPTSSAEWWARRKPDARTCTVCGAEYLSTSTHPSYYCNSRCKARARSRRNRDARMTEEAPAA